MTSDRDMEELAVEFLSKWTSFQQKRTAGCQLSFEATEGCKKFIDMGFVADHVNPHVGEYVIQHAYVGVAFFTGSGELVFLKKGLPFAKKICDTYRKRASDMHIMKLEYESGKN